MKGHIFHTKDTMFDIWLVLTHISEVLRILCHCVSTVLLLL